MNRCRIAAWMCSKVRWWGILLLLFAGLSAAAAAESGAAFVESVEGTGAAQAGTYPNQELARLDRDGALTPRHLEAADALPDWVYALLEGMGAEGFDAWDYTEARMAVVLMETESALSQTKGGITELRHLSDAVPEELLDSYAQTIEAWDRTERLLDDLERLLRYMESKDFVQWQALDAGHRLREGDVILAGEDTEIIVRYDLGAVARVRAGGTVSVWRPAVEQPSLTAVTTRLWQGILHFYCPPGSAAESRFEVETSMVRTGIRGTEWEMEHDRGRTAVRVLSGQVAATDLRTGGTTLLHAGQHAAFGRGNGAAAAGLPDHWITEAAGPYVTWTIPPEWSKIPGVHSIAVVEDAETAEGLEAAVGWLDWYEVTNILDDPAFVRKESSFAGRDAYRIVDPPGTPPGLHGDIYIVRDRTPENEMLAVAAVWDSPDMQAVVQQILASVVIDLPENGAAVPGHEAAEPPVSPSLTAAEALDAIDMQISRLVVQAEQEWSAHPDFAQALHSFRIQLLPALRSITEHWRPAYVEMLADLVAAAEAQLLAHPTYIEELKQVLAALKRVAGRIAAGEGENAQP